ncbi:MAG: REDY-like protein HapK [Pseudomonadota bacterium]
MMKTLLASSAILALSVTGCAQTTSLAEPAQETPISAPAEVNLILIYSLKEGVTPQDFEDWVVSTDYPKMRGLSRVADFRTYRAERLLMGEGKPSVQYIEAFSIPDLDGFIAEDMGGETVQSVMGTFMGFADAPEFIVVTEVK